MKLDATDIRDLEPVIRAAVLVVLEELHAKDATLGNRLGYPEAEAAVLLGVARHVLRDARLRGEIVGRAVGKKIVYSREALLKRLGVWPCIANRSER